MKATIRVDNLELSFDDSDVIDPSDFIPGGDYNPHNVRPWLLHDHGFALAVVFADCLQDALDIAADNGKLDRYQVAESDYADYGIDGDSPTCAFLGNAGEPFDIESLGYVELRNPQFSFAALLAASFPTGQCANSAHFA